MSDINKRVPKRRFMEFNNADAWEQRKLGELGEVTTGKAFSSTSFDNQGEYLVITNKNISDSSRSQNIITNRISISDDEIIQRYRLDGENILVTMDGVNLGKTAMYSNANALLAQRVGRIKSNQLEFIYQITSSNTFLRTMQTLSVGNAIKHISLKQISEYSSLGPKDIIERKKIGSFFKKLDNTIALHQRKLEKIKALKTAYLSELFPAEGETKPKRRFAGFTDDWEQRKLGELAKITMGQSPEGVNYTDNPRDYVLVQGNADMQNGHVVPRVWTKQITKTAKKGDIILSVRAPVGDVGKTNYDVVLGRGVSALEGNEFIFQLLSKMKAENYWFKYSTGSTFESINSNEIKEAIVSSPEKQEQMKIGVFFKQLDSTIALHQRKLQKLQNIKKAYLNEMFI
ncbi:restriction endonuclease subunit S [Listeria monocytogenes]|uniref:restriction endonuclease subunit S n=1 Tax=Listeria monocytogenes TaxID=1639 RepID=UPI0010DA1E9A|nr:restriction endonuclease subunit S [Listeria monocytogenes]EAD7213910.1 restriction endonuclease subunit S [Listeria monocytogenes]EAE6661212.1 restriction endonuclease subunit S [Listeria monocytogenes]EAO7445208.1 restriction endonuclease subunit S [Listeria monocytogenes]